MTLYQTTLCEKLPWDIIDSDFDLDPHGYFDTYNKNDIQLICCQADASVLWLVPNVVQMRFIQSLDRDMDMDIIFTWVLTRDRPKGKEVVKYEKIVSPPDLPKQSDIQKVLNGSTNSFRIYNLYAKHLRVTGSGEVRSFEQEVIYTLSKYLSSLILTTNPPPPLPVQTCDVLLTIHCFLVT